MSEASPAPVPVEELLAHADWVRAVARRLVRDHALADDIAQEALIVGLRTAPREGARLRAWFHAILRNLARDHHRRERARSAREEASARTVFDDDSVHLVERADAQRFLVERILQLREPYRTTLLLRFFEKLSPREIARRHEVPLATVRARLHRGLGLLRGDLERRKGDRWPLAIAPLLAGRLVTTGPRRALPRAGTPARVAAAAAGAALLVAVVAASWPARATAPAGASAGGTQTAAAPESPRLSRADAPRGAAAVAQPTAQPADPSAAAATPTASVRLVLRADSGENGSPAPDPAVEIRFTALLPPVRGAEPTQVVVAARLGEALVAALPAAAPDGRAVPLWEARIDAPHLVPFRAQIAPGGPETAWTLTRAAVVTGHVTPAPAAHAVAAVRDGDVLTTIDTAAAAPDGAFRLRLRPGVEHIVVLAAAGRRPRLVRVTAAASAEQDLGPLALEAGESLSGELVDEHGAAFAGAAVALVAPDLGASLAAGPFSLTVGESQAEHARLVTQTGDDGAFAFTGLPRTPHQVLAGLPGATASLASRLAWTQTPGDPPARRVLETSTLRVAVLRDGRPAPAARLTTASGARVQPHVADADGMLELRAVPDEDVLLQMRDGGATWKRTFRAPAAGAVQHEVLCAGPSERLATWRVRWRGDRAARRCGISLRAAEGIAPPIVQDAAGDGAEVVVTAPPGRWVATLRPGGAWRDATASFAETTVEIDLRAGETTVTDVPLVPGARLVLEARTPGGALVPARCALADADGRRIPLVCPRFEGGAYAELLDVLSASGPTRVFPALLPGTYRLTFEADGCAPRTVEVTLAADEVRRVDVTLEPGH